MVEFEELRQLWQNQTQPGASFTLDGRAIPDILRRFHRRQTAINTFRACLLLFVMVWAPLRGHLGVPGILGAVLMTLGLAVFLVVDWRNQIGIARLDFTQPSAEFVDRSIQRLHDMRYPFRQTFWVFIVSAVVGLNLMWHPVNHPMWYRLVLAHVNATAFPFLAFWLGTKIRAKRFDLECRPIMEKLLSMKQELGEGAR